MSYLFVVPVRCVRDVIRAPSASERVVLWYASVGVTPRSRLGLGSAPPISNRTQVCLGGSDSARCVDMIDWAGYNAGRLNNRARRL